MMQERYVPPATVNTREELIKLYSCWNHHADPGGAWRLFTQDELDDSPSRRDGLDAELERRWKGLMVNLIWKVGEKLTS